MALATQIANPAPGRDARYSLAGLTKIDENTYTDGRFLYDNSGRGKNRPNSTVAGLPPANASESYNVYTGQYTAGGALGGGGGGGGTYLPPGAAAAIAQELALAKEAYDTALAKITNQRQTLGRQSGFTFDVNKDTGETTNMRVDPHAIYGTYQLLNRQEAQNIENARATAIERGLGANGGLGAQLSSRAKFDAGQQDAQFASDLTDQLTNLALQQQDAKHAYDQAKWQAELDKIRLALQNPISYGPSAPSPSPSNPVTTQYQPIAPGFIHAGIGTQVGVNPQTGGGYSINTGGGYYTNTNNALNAKWRAIGLMG